MRLRYSQRLPRICACCGAPSVTSRGIRIYSTWREIAEVFVAVLMTCVPIIWVIVWLASTDMTNVVRLPLCERHRMFRWGWPRLGGFLVFLAVLSLPTLAALTRWPARPLLAAWCVVGLTLVGLAVWMGVLALKIRVRDVRHGEFLLVGVAPAFAEGCRAIRQSEQKQVEDSLDEIFGEQQ